MSNVIAKELDYYIYRPNLARAPKYVEMLCINIEFYMKEPLQPHTCTYKPCMQTHTTHTTVFYIFVMFRFSPAGIMPSVF